MKISSNVENILGLKGQYSHFPDDNLYIRFSWQFVWWFFFLQLSQFRENESNVNKNLFSDLE